MTDPKNILGGTTPAVLPADTHPQLIVVIDTEEEFDWSAEPDPKSVGVTAIDEIGRVQDIFDEYRIKPCYVIDYPVAATAKSAAILRSIHDDGRCEIGAHLHPWVNPPIDEEINRHNTYPGNLAEELERKKLAALTQCIQEAFGLVPTTYKAGRYGLGPNSAKILEDLGFKIDLSVCPAFDYSGDGGPNYSSYSTRPFWFGSKQSMLALPLSGAFVGWGGALRRRLFHVAAKFRTLKVPAIFSRLGVVDRLMLSPEGFSAQEHKNLARHLLAGGDQVFTWSFHSSSVVPGMTTYTRSDAELRQFLDSFRYFFDFFFGDLGGEASSPAAIKKRLEQNR